MKKKIVYALMALMTLSMLLSSFARAQAADQMCSTATTQSADILERKLNKDRADLTAANTLAERTRLKAVIAEDEKELKITNEMLSNCN